MSDWVPKRFWTDATVEEEAGGFAVRLDGRGVRTPAKRSLIVPTSAMADRIAAEWRAQGDRVDPRSMPWTRSANAAIDKVAPQRAEVARHIASYAGTDLLNYRAEAPDELAARQSKAWDPVLDWAQSRFDVRLKTTRGVMPISQDPESLGRLAQVMDPMNDFQLTGFHDLVTLTGSFVLAMAVIYELRPAEELWLSSRVDELWQIEQWGSDEEAERDADTRKGGFLHATEFYFSA